MSLATNVNNLATAVATQVKSLWTAVNGNDGTGVSNLATTATTLVGAINEVHEAVAGASGIDDTTTSTDTTWSSSKINTTITTDVAALINDSTASSSKVYSSTKTDSQIGGLINDSSTSSSKVWSSSKTNTEIGSQITAAIADFPLIDDDAPSDTSVYSSDKVDSQIAAAKSDILGGAGPAFDTLQELADALGDDADFAGTVTTALGLRVAVDAAQTFNSTQQTQGRSNIGAAAASDLTTLSNSVGDTTTDFSATFAAGLSS